jgi:hypothetical protein
MATPFPATGSTPRTTGTRSSVSGASSLVRPGVPRSSPAGTAARRPGARRSAFVDLALTFFDGRRAPPCRTPMQSPARAYARVVSFGSGPVMRTCASRRTTRTRRRAGRPARPAPAAERRPTRPGSGSLAVLPYETVRAAADPRAALLAFLASGYPGGGRGPDGIRPTWHVVVPRPPALSAILEPGAVTACKLRSCVFASGAMGFPTLGKGT